jgi:hypothetical protein
MAAGEPSGLHVRLPPPGHRLWISEPDFGGDLSRWAPAPPPPWIALEEPQPEIGLGIALAFEIVSKLHSSNAVVGKRGT